MATSSTSGWRQRAVTTMLLPLLLACLGPPAYTQSLPGHGEMHTTNFSCIGKVIGGYYADQYTNCQMFHVCTLDEKGKVNDYTFRCLAGTVFDQETRVCERAEEVDCSRSQSFFHLNNDLYGPGIIPSTAHITVIDAVEETARTDISARTADTTTTTTAAPAPPFVFPETSFTCLDKIHGGLYADVETGCKVFHICSVEPDKSTKDNKFVCGPGTLFNQKSRTCQVESGVDCLAAPSFYYLNDRGNLPDVSVDLCASRPLGTPLADITSGCLHYSTCERLEDGRLVETRHGCKKGLLFSQMRKRCVLAKKVECVKETLSEILGLGAATRPSRRSRKRRAAALLSSHRFRRAALQPLVNMVKTPEVEDAQVRRALSNLAALQQWMLENAQHSTFVELYSLSTDNPDNQFPKKTYAAVTSPERAKTYEYVLRRKRDAANVTVEKQVEFVNHTVSRASQGLATALVDPLDLEATHAETGEDSLTRVTFTGTLALPTIATMTIGQRSKVQATVAALKPDDSPTAPSLPAIPTTLSTFTVSGTPTMVPSVVTVTVTTTKTVIPSALATAAAGIHSTAVVGNPGASGVTATPVLDDDAKSKDKVAEGVTDVPSALSTLCMLAPPIDTKKGNEPPKANILPKRNAISDPLTEAPEADTTTTETPTTTPTTTTTTTTTPNSPSGIKDESTTTPSTTSSTTTATPSPASNSSSDNSSSNSDSEATTTTTTTTATTTNPVTTTTESTTTAAPGTATTTTTTTTTTAAAETGESAVAVPEAQEEESVDLTVAESVSTPESAPAPAESEPAAAAAAAPAEATSNAEPASDAAEAETAAEPASEAAAAAPAESASNAEPAGDAEAKPAESVSESASADAASAAESAREADAAPAESASDANAPVEPSNDAETVPAEPASDAETVPAESASDAGAAPADSASDADAAPAEPSSDADAAPAESASDADAAPAEPSSDADAPAESASDADAAPAESASDADAAPAEPAGKPAAAPAEETESSVAAPASGSEGEAAPAEAAAAHAEPAVESMNTTTTTTTTEAQPSTTPATTLDKENQTKVEESAAATTGNDTTTTTTTTEFVMPSGSINVSTTVVPDGESSTTNTSFPPSATEASVTPGGVFTTQTLSETNFTCKDKKLEQFYPDPEANCQVFHYCLPGFRDKQVLDLKFLCTGATKFDIRTQKCEDRETVTCGQVEDISVGNTTSTTSTTTTTTSSTTSTTTGSTTTLAAVTETPANETTTPEGAPANKTETDSTVTADLRAESLNDTANATTEAPAAQPAPAEADLTTTKEPEATTTTTVKPDNTTAEHKNWNETKPETHVNETKTIEGEAPSVTQPPETPEEVPEEVVADTEAPQVVAEEEEQTEESDIPSTTFSPTEDYATETEIPDTEVVTEQEEEYLSTEAPVTTEAVPEEEEVTELGPLVRPDHTLSGMQTPEEEPVEESQTKPSMEAATLSTTTDPSVPTEESSTDTSVSTDVSVVSSDFVSSATQVSSDVSVSSSVQPGEDAS